MSEMRSVGHKVFVTLLVLSAMFILSSFTVVFAADVYPSKTVRLIVPWPPGATTDTVGRMVASKLSGRLGKQVIVENRGGALGVIGAETAAKANPDGYTLLMVQDSHTVTPATLKLSYDFIKDFTPIAKIGRSYYLIVAHPSLPANSLKEFVVLAKQKPGQLIFASLGLNGTVHLSVESFKMKAGIDFKIVQFKGGAPAIIDVLGGHSHVTMISIGTSMPHFQSGKLKPLATCAPERSALLPHVPTTAEESAPWLQTGVWWGFVAPAGTPRQIVDRLDNELKTILTSDELKQWFLSRGWEVSYQGPNDFGTFLKEEVIKWAEIVKKANIKQE